MHGYYSQPTIYNDNLVFVSEDDLWLIKGKDSTAIRLTSNLGMLRQPQFSPDGKYLAFISTDEGMPEIYVMPAEGGEATRLTWLGTRTSLIGWKGDKIIFASAYRQAFMSDMAIYSLDLQGNPPELLPYGLANAIAWGEKGVVLGRNISDPARWKRYKGGTAGYLLIDQDGKGDFQPLLKLKGNVASPMWIGKRIYFLSDHEGIGNIYSCLPDGKSIKKHSNHTDYYARNANTDGKSIVWRAGGDLWKLDIKTDAVTKVEISYHSPFVQRKRKFVEPAKYMDSAALSKDAGSLAVTIRGKAFGMGAWEGSVQQYGEKHHVRYRMPVYLHDGKSLLLLSDGGDKEHLEIHPLRADFADAPKAKIKSLDKLDIGRPYDLKLCPVGTKVALHNHRNELLIVDYDKVKAHIVDQNKHGMMQGYDWSPDGRYLAYGTNLNTKTTYIRIYDTEKDKYHDITKPVLEDSEPMFDPDGKYLYFMSLRTFEPLGDTVQFDFSFPNAIKPYLIPLKSDTRSPFLPEVKGFEPKPSDETTKAVKDAEAVHKEEDKEEAKEKKPEPPKPVEIDFEGISDRVVEFPVKAGYYFDLQVTPGRIYYSSMSFEQRLSDEHSRNLWCYDLNKQEGWTYLQGIKGYQINPDHSAMLVDFDKKLRVVSAKLEPKQELPGDPPTGRKSGWIDLSRIKVEIEPLPEWQQMFREAWRLQKYHFWTEDMSGIDWQKVFDRYYPLVSLCGCRSEFSDVMWEMQGELGTSHCYEFGGEYRPSPNYRIGQLGIDHKYNPKKKAYEITRIVKGAHWVERDRPVFMNPGLGVKPGWFITAINGQALTSELSPEKALVNQAGVNIQISVMSPDGKTKKNLTVKTMNSDSGDRYRDWIEHNLDYVHTKSGGKLGYIHIPDMGQAGLTVFTRMFLAEVDYDGLVVDVRYNGGGSTSGLFLQKLARKRIGYDLTRWWGASPYPADAPMGTMVCLTNEYAGSDGDIFSHSWKLMGLGKLVGKRTWGGVIGIWPRNTLVDGTMTSQPEFSFWFKDVGWGVENYGTDPDIEVDIMPSDYLKGIDPQLDTAIQVAMDELKANPPMRPDFSNKPQLPLP